MTTFTDSSQQLSLLPSASVPARFQLSEATRRRGRRHAAEIRAQLAALKDAEQETIHRLPPRPSVADLRPAAA